MNIYTPYTYLIGWSKHQKYYYGARWAKHCHPSDLWKTYFTSSKSVKQFRKKYGNPDIIEIRKTFSSKTEVRLWEHKVLRRLRVKNNPKWLNITSSLGIDYEIHPFLDKTHSEETKMKISQSLTGKKDKEETKKKKSEIAKKRTGEKNGMFGKLGSDHPNYGMKHTEETKKIMSEKKRGENHPNFGKKRPDHSKKMSGENHFNYRKNLEENTRSKISKTLKNKPIVKCKYCDFKHYIKAHLVRYHNDNCKHKPF
jgi:hypothetical protein